MPDGGAECGAAPGARRHPMVQGAPTSAFMPALPWSTPRAGDRARWWSWTPGRNAGPPTPTGAAGPVAHWALARMRYSSSSGNWHPWHWNAKAPVGAYWNRPDLAHGGAPGQRWAGGPSNCRASSCSGRDIANSYGLAHRIHGTAGAGRVKGLPQCAAAGLCGLRAERTAHRHRGAAAAGTGLRLNGCALWGSQLRDPHWLRAPCACRGAFQDITTAAPGRYRTAPERERFQLIAQTTSDLRCGTGMCAPDRRVGPGI